MNFRPTFSISLFVLLLEMSYASSLQRHREDPDNNIIGGRPAEIWEFPYQVSIQSSDEHNCGGSIITPRHILTAAHCFSRTRPEETKVRAGSSSTLYGGNLVKAKKIYSHPLFETIDYDIAIVELEEALTFSKNVQPIQLPPSNYTVIANSVGTLTGWGLTDPSSTEFAPHLMTVDVPIISHEECVEEYPNDPLTERQLCAGLKEGGKDSCSGDSGGPLVANGIQVGIVSWGKSCGVPKQPGVYTRVSEPGMRNFIQSIADI